MRVLVVLIATAGFVAASVPYEWAGTFSMPNSAYVWTSQKKNGAYADATMDMVFLNATGTSAADLTALNTTGIAGLYGTCTSVYSGGTVNTTGCYRLVFNQNLHTSQYIIDAANVNFMAIFAQHVPTEFERDRHYLQDVSGTDIEPVAQLPATATTTTDKKWGEAIGATLLVLFCTLIGVIFAAPGFSYLMREHPEVVFTSVNAFAAGALLACAFYLMMYEATHLIKPDGSDEPAQTAYWGSMILGGFLVASFIDFFVGLMFQPVYPEQNGHSQVTETQVNEVPLQTQKQYDTEIGVGNGRSCCGGDAIGPVSLPAAMTTADEKPVATNTAPAEDTSMFGSMLPNKNSIRILSSVLVGDFVHNLVDGIVIGAAFLGCSTTMAWTITGSTVAHELAQEISDYVVLTSPNHGGLKPLMALLLNFLSGTSVVLGAIIVLANDSVSNFSQGCLLAFGAGVYLQIGAAECMPRVYEYATSTCLRAGAIFAFFIGAMAIGLVLLKHEHCVPSGAAAHAH